MPSSPSVIGLALRIIHLALAYAGLAAGWLLVGGSSTVSIAWIVLALVLTIGCAAATLHFISYVRRFYRHYFL